MDRLARRAFASTLGVAALLMFLGTMHAWLLLPWDDPRLTRRQEVAARMLPPYAAYLLLADVHRALAYPPAARDALQQCLVSLRAQGYAEWSRIAACECHALEGESLAACFSRH